LEHCADLICEARHSLKFSGFSQKDWASSNIAHRFLGVYDLGKQGLDSDGTNERMSQAHPLGAFLLPEKYAEVVVEVTRRTGLVEVFVFSADDKCFGKVTKNG